MSDESKHVCDDCGESFQTLTKLRLHEKDDRPHRETFAKLDPSSNDVGLQAAEEVLTCRDCGQESPNADFEETSSLAGEDLHLIVEFDCRRCGFANENRLVMEGVDRSNLDELPPHLRPEDADGGDGDGE